MTIDTDLMVTIMAQFESGHDFHARNPFEDLTLSVMENTPRFMAFLDAVVKSTAGFGGEELESFALAGFLAGLACGCEYALRQDRPTGLVDDDAVIH